MMRFFLVGTDHKSATLRLITDAVFDTRRDALAFLSSEAASSALVGLEEEVYVVDLDVATPVLIVPQQSPGEQQVQEAAEEDAPPVHDEPADAFAAVAISDDQPALEDPGLADALRRAAGSLESEGIVAPESIGSAAGAEAGTAAYPTPYVPEPAAWPWDPSALEDEESAESLGAPEDSEEPPALEDAAPEPAASEDEGLSEATPDEDVVRSIEEPEAPTEAEAPPTPVYEFDALEEPAVDGTDLVSAPDEEAVYGRTVVMGEYGEDEADAPGLPIEPMGANGDGALTFDGPGPVLIEDAGPDDTSDVEIPSDPPSDEPLGVVEEPLIEPVVTPVETAVMNAYACDDCVYVNTCPKHHDSDPSSCGSFQWKTA